jgi:hypothetical protein
MRNFKIWFLPLLLSVAVVGCGGTDTAPVLPPPPGDTTAPIVNSTVPASAATAVAMNGSITATFSESMTPGSVSATSFTLTDGTNTVAGAVTLVGKVATLTPTGGLLAGTHYTATISTGVKDLAGNAMAALHSWSFTTGSVSDTTAPTVASSAPANLATNVATSGGVSVTFSEPMDTASISGLTFTLTDGANAVAGTVTLSGDVATLTPTSALLASTSYTATVSTGAKDLAGNALVAPFIWSFTTAAGTSVGIAAVDLKSAAGFVILSKSGVTDVFPSVIKGDVGSSPIAGSAILLTCAEVAGAIYSVDATGPLPCRISDPVLLTAAVGDMMLAYDDAKGRINPVSTELGAGEIGGLTLTAGLYSWSSPVTISTDLTLSGSATDVWIFQVAGTLDLASAKKVTLAGNALARNVFWQVAGAVTIGTTATMEGTILGFTNIAMNTGATLNGRAMAQTAVTLQSSTLTLPQ